LKKHTNYKVIVAVPLVALAFTFIPFAGFAKNDNPGKGNGQDKSSMEIRGNAYGHTKFNFHSFWNRFSHLFNTHVKADSTTTSSTSLTPSISGITSPTVLKVGETGTWTIKASDPENEDLSYAVDWGDDDNDSMAKMAQTSFVQTSTFTHAYAKTGTYTVKFTITNESDLKTTSAVTVHVVAGNAVHAPVITDVVADSLRPRQASVSWKTDVKGSSMIWLSKTNPVDTSK
jgi:hypothetical protein